MESKTPQFDKLIDEILENLKPETRTCKWKDIHKYCEGEFEIEAEDIHFLKMFRVPPPDFCPTCRRIRRMVYMNYTKLSKRRCDVPGHNEMMISILPEECPFPVYDYHYFISDSFDPFSFGLTYLSGNSPMETFFSLRKKFPMPSFLNRDPSCVNSEYSNGGLNLKNGYFVFTCHDVENVWYSNVIFKSKNIMDCYWTNDSEWVYESIFCDHLYQSSFIYFSSSCTDSMFLFDCKNCDSCFGCVNLRNKKYCVFNEQLSKDEYQAFLRTVYPLSRGKIIEYKEKFWQLVKTLPMSSTRNVAVTNVLGINLRNSKNLYDVADANNSENVRHSDEAIDLKDSMDITYSGKGSLIYMSTNAGVLSSNIKFSVSTKFSTNCEYCFNSKNLNDCFMCFGLQNKSYCILNKQYSKDEYFKIIDEIKTEMLKKSEYGNGVGMEFSAQAYNFSVGQIAFPLTEKEIKKLSGYVAQDPETNAKDINLISVNELPKIIEDVDEEISNKAIKCEITGRPFRIITSEIEFYIKMKLPLPSIHPSVRMENRIKLPTSGQKHKTKCAKCNKDIISMFNPAEKFILYCESCFKQEIY